MPKVVDHDRRRDEIIRATWRIIAEEGIGAATTRRIAEVTGRANGVLLYYFPNKAAVLRAALTYAFDETNRRADAVAPVRHGLSGLRTLCHEIMPLDELRRMEARIVLTFWASALTSPETAELFADLMAIWRAEISQRLDEAKGDGDVDDGLDVTATADALLSLLMGLQALACLTPDETDAERQLAELELFLGRLGPA
ncbi:TetR/AcrR family transcriptional regulator [Microbacterium ulmi]|uniref:TetR/AcrR family transcriptional regulator n=1 Tax=Microbacterium ulmi TaxID=179095 RepID=A0A7Y2PZV0_9MICO|nr:TetR family transcriptional regulator C-terminal domain-containing protein [Microbacterium ulmi]NII70054.1 AcrR family transcriptional regulator [Microbacterium ulmi]NNH04856.1 TetR/AcrR family transcriptional regulator [Microbacterium ulmi]